MAQHERVSDGDRHWREFEDIDILSMLHVHLLCAYRMTLGPEWSRRDVLDAKNRLYYVLDGGGEMICGGQKTALLPGHLYLIPSGARRTYGCERRLELYWSHFTMRLHSGRDVFEGADNALELQPTNPAKVARQFKEMAASFEDNAAATVLSRSGILMQLVAPFLNAVDPLDLQRRLSAMLPFQSLLTEIEAHCHAPVDIPRLAASIGMSASHFTRRFTEALGVSPGRYILRRRIEEAQLRLVQGDEKLETIGIALGFCDGFHFSRTFKKLTGISPSHYRAMVRQP